jgi:hypothetical protein
MKRFRRKIGAAFIALTTIGASLAGAPAADAGTAYPPTAYYFQGWKDANFSGTSILPGVQDQGTCDSEGYRIDLPSYWDSELSSAGPIKGQCNYLVVWTIVYTGGRATTLKDCGHYVIPAKTLGVCNDKAVEITIRRDVRWPTGP